MTWAGGEGGLSVPSKGSNWCWDPEAGMWFRKVPQRKRNQDRRAAGERAGLSRGGRQKVLHILTLFRTTALPCCLTMTFATEFFSNTVLFFANMQRWTLHSLNEFWRVLLFTKVFSWQKGSSFYEIQLSKFEDLIAFIQHSRIGQHSI